MADEWNKSAGVQTSRLELPLPSSDQKKLLLVQSTNGDNHAATFCELSREWFGDVGRGGGNNDNVVWCKLRDSQCAVAYNHPDIVIAESAEGAVGNSRQFWMTFDAEHFLRKLRH